MAEPFATIALVVDTSMVRQRERAVRARWDATVRAGPVASCPVVALELLAAARHEREHRALSVALHALPQAPVTGSVCRAALTASSEFNGRRRLPAIDYLIAAAAAERGFGGCTRIAISTRLPAAWAFPACGSAPESRRESGARLLAGSVGRLDEHHVRPHPSVRFTTMPALPPFACAAEPSGSMRTVKR
jgi:predicted nucleic acid-binding protein